MEDNTEPSRLDKMGVDHKWRTAFTATDGAGGSLKAPLDIQSIYDLVSRVVT